MNTNEFKDFYKRKNYRPYDYSWKQFMGYKQAMKDVLKIIEESHDLWDLQNRLISKSMEDLNSKNLKYQSGYYEFIMQIKSEVHRRKMLLKED